MCACVCAALLRVSAVVLFLASLMFLLLCAALLLAIAVFGDGSVRSDRGFVARSPCSAKPLPE